MKTAVLVFDDTAVLELGLFALALRWGGGSPTQRAVGEALGAWLGSSGSPMAARRRGSTLPNATVALILEHTSTPDPLLDAVRLAVIAELQAVPSPPPPPPPPPPPDPLIGQKPAQWSGEGRLVAVWDQGSLPDWLRSKGYDGSDSALAYACCTTMWAGDGWPQGSIDGSLYNRRNEMADLGWAHIDAMAPFIRAQGEGTVVAVVNDGPDRLGRRTASVTVDRLGRFGLSIQPGETVPD